MGGIETWRDGLEFILMGCTNLQVTTSVMQYGYRIIDDMLDGLSRWLTAAGYSSVSEVVGLANKNMTDASSLDRDTVTYPISTRTNASAAADATSPAMTQDIRLSTLTLKQESPSSSAQSA